MFQNGLALDNQNSLKHEDNSLKHLQTANLNSLWAYIREGVFLEGLIIRILRYLKTPSAGPAIEKRL